MITEFVTGNIPLGGSFDGDYYQQARRALMSANSICYCNIFIVDHDLDNYLELRVDSLLFELSYSSWRGTDTKLIIGGSKTNRRILETSIFAYHRAIELGIDTRLVPSTPDVSSHQKLIIADNVILTGSHNWSRSMFGVQTQDSVILKNDVVASKLSDNFISLWSTLKPGEYALSI